MAASIEGHTQRVAHLSPATFRALCRAGSYCGQTVAIVNLWRDDLVTFLSGCRYRSRPR